MEADNQPLLIVPEWVEQHCVIPDGFKAGKPFELYNYQFLYLVNFYLVRGDAEFIEADPVLGPAFVYRRGILVGPQKVGKNPLTAAHVCVEGVGPALFAGWAGKNDGWSCKEHGCPCGWEYPYEPGEPMAMSWPTPLIQITAFSEESTDNTYDALRPMIERGPLADVIPKTGEDFIRLPGGGRIDTVTSSAQSRLGQRVTFVPQDEVGIWTVQNKMAKVADTQYRGLAGMGGRASLTSNAWDPSEASVAKAHFTSPAQDIYRQFVGPPKNLSYGNKRERAKIHRIVYPEDTLREHGGHVNLDGIEAEAADLLVRDAPQAARFFGNILVPGAGRAVDPEQWEKAKKQGAPEPGARIGLGFDGSLSGDATALIGCTEGGHLFEIAVWQRPAGAPPEWRVPRLEVERTVSEVFDTYEVGRMLCDPPRWQTEIERWVELYGDETVLFFDTNQPRRMGPACVRFVTGLAEGPMSHDGSPTLTAHVLAMVKKYTKATADESDGRTLYVFTKDEEGNKIDAGIGAVLAYEAAMSMEPAEESSEPWALVV